MTRRNGKRNERRNRNHRNFTEDKTANMAAAMVFGAIMSKILGKSLTDKEEHDKPFSGIRKVSDKHLESGIIVPADGSATEIPIPEGFDVFISEEGKPMIRRKIEDEGEPVNDVPKPITYEDIAKDLYKDNGRKFFWNSDTDFIDNYSCDWDFKALINCMSETQVKRLMAFNKLQNIAIYLNDGWHPDFNDESKKWFIMSNGNFKYKVGYNTRCMGSGVHFKTKELAEEAARIMGEESLADLFNPNW